MSCACLVAQMFGLVYLLAGLPSSITLHPEAENPSEAQAKEAGQLAEQGDRLAAEAGHLSEACAWQTC